MATRFAERPEVEFGDPPAAKVFRRRRWTLGRIATDLAIVMVAVSLGTNFLAGPRIVGECGTTLDNFALAAGFWFLAAKAAWVPLKALNDAGERWLDSLTASRSRPKPQTPGRPLTP